MYSKERKLVPLVKKHIQFLCLNPKMMHVPLDVQVLVLIAWGRQGVKQEF